MENLEEQAGVVPSQLGSNAGVARADVVGRQGGIEIAIEPVALRCPGSQASLIAEAY